MNSQLSATNIKGILLDMDGTLVDHLETLTRCFQYACRELGFPEPSLELVKRSIGGSMPVTIQKFLPAEQVEKGKELWQQHFEEIHLQGVVVLPGAENLLKLCRASGIKRGVFTNKTGTHTRAILDNEKLSPLIDFTLGSADVPFRKPQVEFSEIAIERIGLPAATVAMIGDSHFDVQAAKAVGMMSLGVTTGSHSADELLEAGADKVFDTLQDIADWIENSQKAAKAS